MRHALFALLLVLSAFTLRAAETYVYHGALRLADGRALPADGRTFDLTFRLYVQATEGSCLWEETQMLTCDRAGNFVAALGQATPGIEEVFAGVQDTLYLGISVDGGTELQPRQRLLSVPMVHHAAVVARSYRDFPIDGSVTAGTLAAETLRTKTLNTAGGTASNPSLRAGAATFAGGLKVAGDVTVGGKADFRHGVTAHAYEGFSAALPGMILPWMPATESTPVPDGWVLCDGQNGTPDLIGCFIAGAGGTYNVRDIGGVESVKLSTVQLPSHTHGFSYSTANKMNNYAWSNINSDYNKAEDDIWTNAFDSNDHFESRTSSPSGGGGAHENRPKFYALRFIMRASN